MTIHVLQSISKFNFQVPTQSHQPQTVDMELKLPFCFLGIPWKRIGVIIGAVFMAIPLGVPWIYGNLSEYTDSYFIAKLGPTGHTGGSLWMMSVFLVCMNLGVPLSGLLALRISPRLASAMGMIAYNLGMYMTYFTVQHSFVAMHITFGAITGLSTGFCYSLMLLFPALWMPPNQVALASSIVIAAFGGGSLIFNQALTMFINPLNEKPNFSTQQSNYFSQDHIIIHVPDIFLILGAMSSLFHICAMILLRNPDNSALELKNSDTTVTKLETTDINVKNSNTKQWKNYSSLRASCSNTITNLKDDPEQAENAECLSSWKVLKSAPFYLIAVSLSLTNASFIMETNYYKQFGLVYISDDYFLTNLGIATSIAVCASRVFLFGSLLHYLSFKAVAIFTTSTHAIAVVFLYFTPRIDKWLYFVWSAVSQALQSGNVIVYPIATLRIFGPKHYATNFGLIMFFGCFIMISLTALVEVILLKLGWFWVFFSISFISLVAMVLSSLLPPGTNTA